MGSRGLSTRLSLIHAIIFQYKGISSHLPTRFDHRKDRDGRQQFNKSYTSWVCSTKTWVPILIEYEDIVSIV